MEVTHHARHSTKTEIIHDIRDCAQRMAAWAMLLRETRSYSERMHEYRQLAYAQKAMTALLDQLQEVANG